jgi:hypothetical protein
MYDNLCAPAHIHTIYLPICLSNHLSVYPSIYLSIIYLSIIYLSIYLSIIY